jgi:hypothetical protein
MKSIKSWTHFKSWTEYFSELEENLTNNRLKPSVQLVATCSNADGIDGKESKVEEQLNPMCSSL